MAGHAMAYEEIRARNTQAPEERSPAIQHALGTFLTEWWKLEHLLQQHTQAPPFRLHLAAKSLLPPLRDATTGSGASATISCTDSTFHHPRNSQSWERRSQCCGMHIRRSCFYAVSGALFTTG